MTSAAGPDRAPVPAAASPPRPAADAPSPVAAVLGGAPSAWTFAELTHNQGNQATDGIWRVTGPAGSAVLKLCVPRGSGSWATSPDPRHWNHWRREPLAYRTGLATTAYADAGIGGPRLLAAEERDDGGFALWLEDVAGLPGSRWPVPRLAGFAHALGAAQARWTGRLPAEPWLSSGWLRQYVASKPLPAAIPWDHPAATAVWPPALRAGLRRMWERRDTLLTAAEAAPRTLCHLDVWPLNLLAVDAPAGPAPEPAPGAEPASGADGGTAAASAIGTARGAALGAAAGSAAGAAPKPGPRPAAGPAARDPAPAKARTVLLDWAFVGDGAVGEDIANLIPDCVADGLMPADLLPEISAAVLDSYLAGLRDGGYRADEDVLRRSVAAAGAAKYCWLAPLMLTRLAAGDRVGSASYDVGGDDAAVLRRRTGLFEHLTAWSDQTLGRPG